MTNAELLLQWMSATYGKAKIAREWFGSGSPERSEVERTLAVWDIDLRRYSSEVVQQACMLVKSQGGEFPPSMPVFIKHCAAIARDRPEHQLLPSASDPDAPMLPPPRREVSRETLRRAVTKDDGDPTRWIGKLFRLGRKGLSNCQVSALSNAFRIPASDVRAGNFPAEWIDRYREQYEAGGWQAIAKIEGA